MTTQQAEQPDIAAVAAQRVISLRRWFLAYGLTLGMAAGFLWMLLQGQPLAWDNWASFKASVTDAGPAIKLIILGIYLSLCCTFLPMPTGWLLSAAAMQETAVFDSMWATVLAVSAVGALASTLANLNDYHMFTLLLRSQRVAKIRNTKTYALAVLWFEKSPFALVLIFNILPIPLDVVRPIAASHGYPRLPFAAANFIGRFGRYFIIAFITYQLGNKGWIATLVLLGAAVVFGLPKAVRLFINRKKDRSQS